MKRYFLLSLILHSAPLLLLFLLSGSGSSEGDSKSNKASGSPDSATIVDKGANGKPKPPIEMEITLVDPEPPKSDGAPECAGDNWYGGIGIVQDERTGILLTVAKGYPAERAGLLVGDRLLTRLNIRGEVGTIATVTLVRDGSILQYNIMREKICTEQVSPQV